MARPAIDRQVERRLAERDVRYTTGRRVVVDALDGVDGPRSAAELSDIIGDSVPLSSLYRSLAVLQEAGVLAPHYSSPGLTRYELAEWLSGHHHHLVCIDCGQVQDLPAVDPIEDRLQEIVADIAREASFTGMHHALEIEGRCLRCA